MVRFVRGFVSLPAVEPQVFWTQQNMNVKVMRAFLPNSLLSVFNNSAAEPHERLRCLGLLLLHPFLDLTLGCDFLCLVVLALLLTYPDVHRLNPVLSGRLSSSIVVSSLPDPFLFPSRLSSFSSCPIYPSLLLLLVILNLSSSLTGPHVFLPSLHVSLCGSVW